MTRVARLKSDIRQASNVVRPVSFSARTRVGFYRLSRHALSEWYNE